jgi:hypothetical protein
LRPAAEPRSPRTDRTHLSWSPMGRTSTGTSGPRGSCRYPSEVARR